MIFEHKVLIDQVLQTNAQYEKAQAERVGISTGEVPGVEDLRKSWLGQHLIQLAEIAENGLGTLSKTEARSILDEVYQSFFSGPFDKYSRIPAYFSNEPLGQMLNRARARMLDLEEVVNVTEASKVANVSRAQIYVLIDVGQLHPIDMNGRLMVERRELNDLKK